VRTASKHGQVTRDRIVAAAVETLKREGFGGSTARAIATTGGFNQALVFYHFGSLNNLLLAALDRTSATRMARYREAVEEVRSLPELMRVAAGIYREDLEAGHIKVLAELIAGASSQPGLGPAIVERVEPWIRFAEEAIERCLAGSPLQALVPVQEAAHAVTALYLGLELMTHLEGDGTRAEQLIAAATNAVNLVGGLFGMGRAGEER